MGSLVVELLQLLQFFLDQLISFFPQSGFGDEMSGINEGEDFAYRAPLKIAFYGNFVVTKFSREHVQVVRFPAQKFGCLKISRKNLIFRGALHNLGS